MPTDDVEEGQRHATLSYSIPSFFSILDTSLVIPNKISMARDQLAGERNFLTFLRFSCTLIILGFTMLIEFRLPYKTSSSSSPSNIDAISQPLGYCFVAAGFCLFLYGVGRYFFNQRALIREVNFIQAGWFSLTVMVLLGSFAIGVMVVLSINSAMFSKSS
ncbi:uncharacterized protein BX664DRAFT_326744 [Halteromyces radiatus]|uniref:uncharacterized protein n=1 Tax=Halteromyces radiatus TaxID=101107 RepID=UPI00221FFA2C|nr:uncharacterized protein BX664DRAFT_326744 [Halteromyces radiatus]KAI8097588.1 hypothetical protein BX664DRAFT_326744 [Halteromyces radiatus]